MPIKEPLPLSIQASLKVISGVAKGEVFPLHYTRNVIGRKTGDIIFKDSKISQKHATIEYVKGSFYLVDLNSKNGS